MKFFTPEDIAKLMQVDVDIVISWLKQRRLAGIKIGTIWRVTEEQFVAFIQAHSVSEEKSPAHDIDSKSESLVEEYEGEFSDNTDFEGGYLDGLRKRAGKRNSKYESLKAHLKHKNGNLLRLSFSEIERIIDAKLPNSAYCHLPWWGNDFSHSQARAWMHAGWNVKKVDLARKEVVFEQRKGK